MKPPVVPKHLRKKHENAPEFFADDWLFVKQIPIKAGEVVEQHVHEYDHVTGLVSGTVRVWIDGSDHGEFTAPKLISVPAGKRHMFLAVSDAVLYCIHNLRGEGYPATRK